MSTFKQLQEEKIRKLEIQARENKAIRKELKKVTNSLLEAQERIKELEQPNYSHNEAINIAVKHGFITKFEK
jgi:predicted nuclease with TOPRIM domain